MTGGSLLFDRTGAGLPDPVTAANAPVDPLETVFIVADAAAARDIELLQALDHKPNHLARHVDVGYRPATSRMIPACPFAGSSTQ